MDNQTTNFDIVISGGGLSGSLMALSLADLKKSDGTLLSIAIVESALPLNSNSKQNTSNASMFDNRVLALSHGSSSYLKKLNVWQHLANAACPIEQIDISDKGYYGKARLKAEEQGVNALGYVIEMALIGEAQLNVLSNKSNIKWFSPDRIKDIQWQPNKKEDDLLSSTNCKVGITLDSGKILQTKLLLACDGVNSPCRALAGIKVNQHDYKQVALIANVATRKPHNNKAFERFTKFGPLAMLPLTQLKSQTNTEKASDNRCSLVWTMTQKQSEEILSLSDSDFRQELEIAFGSWLGEITQVGKREVYPLVLKQAAQQTYHRMALIGNASHTIHPIAGQGFNLGLRDVQQISSLIEHALVKNMDIGSFALLNEYAQERQLDQNQVIGLTDALVTLFSNDYLPLVIGRNIGLKVMNYVSPIKNTLVNKLMGY